MDQSVQSSDSPQQQDSALRESPSSKSVFPDETVETVAYDTRPTSVGSKSQGVARDQGRAGRGTKRKDLGRRAWGYAPLCFCFGHVLSRLTNPAANGQVRITEMTTRRLPSARKPKMAKAQHRYMPRNSRRKTLTRTKGGRRRKPPCYWVIPVLAITGCNCEK